MTIEDESADLDEVIAALNPFGYHYLLSITGISGPGNYVVVYATLGDFHVACVNHNAQVMWDFSCGMSEPEPDTIKYVASPNTERITKS